MAGRVMIALAGALLLAAVGLLGAWRLGWFDVDPRGTAQRQVIPTDTQDQSEDSEASANVTVGTAEQASSSEPANTDEQATTPAAEGSEEGGAEPDTGGLASGDETAAEATAAEETAPTERQTAERAEAEPEAADEGRAEDSLPPITVPRMPPDGELQPSDGSDDTPPEELRAEPFDSGLSDGSGSPQSDAPQEETTQRRAQDGGQEETADPDAAQAQAGQSGPEQPQASAPTAEEQANKQGSKGPSFDVVRVERTGETVIAGRAPPGAQVTVLENDRPIATARSNERGEFVAIPGERLGPGERQLTLKAEDADGETQESDQAVVISVPRQSRSQPVQQAAEADQASAEESAGESNKETGETERRPLAVLVPREGTGSVDVLQRPDGKSGLESQELVLSAVQYTTDGRIAVSGQARKGSLVLVYLNNAQIADTRTSEEGDWSVVPDATIPPGLHTLRVDQVDDAGKVEARVETPFANQPMVDSLDHEGFIVVQPGNNLWTIARRTYGRGIEYTVIYDANEDQIRDPDLIYPGQVFVLPDEMSAGEQPR